MEYFESISEKDDFTDQMNEKYLKHTGINNGLD
jgi:hypothetical protein